MFWQAIPEEERAKEVKDLDLDQDILPVERALGVQWCAQSDTFGFSISIPEKPLTRRGILSTVGSFYDPLGILSPVIFTAKRILQDLCRKGLGWDDAIPASAAQEWNDWVKELQTLNGFRTSRCLKPPNFGEITSAQLHHFADASEEGYGSYLPALTQSSRSCTWSLHNGKIQGGTFKDCDNPTYGANSSGCGSSNGQAVEKGAEDGTTRLSVLVG